MRESFLLASRSGPGSDDTYKKREPKPKQTSKTARCRGSRSWKLSPRKPFSPGAHGVPRRGGAGAGGAAVPGSAARRRRGRAMGAEAGGPRDTAPGQQLRALFYALPPAESSFRTVEEVPDYVEKVRVLSFPTLAASFPFAHLRLFSKATGASRKPCPRKGT